MADRFDVFVSCAGEDRPWVERVLVPLLDAAQLAYVTQKNLPVGEEVITSMNRAIASARCTILVISRAWINSGYAQYEGTRAFRRKLDGDDHRVLPLMIQECEPPEHIRDIIYLRLHESADVESDLRQFIETIGPPVVAMTTPAQTAAKDLRLLHDVIKPNSDTKEAEELFAAISAQIVTLSDLKRFHELLHQLQSWQEIVAPHLVAPPRNDEAIADLVVHADELRDLVRELAVNQEKCSLSKKLLSWIADVQFAYEILNRALDPPDPPALRQVNRIIDRVLGVQPAIMNTQMFTVAEHLPIAQLESTAASVIEQARGKGFEEGDLRRLRNALLTLTDLMRGVADLTSMHNDWQKADVELRLATRSTLDDLLEDWPRVREILTCLLRSDGEWTTDMKSGCALVEEAIRNGSHSRVGLEVRRLRGHAVRWFHKVDIRLLQHCEELRQVRSSFTSTVLE